eukprot:9396108-Ditylum_brightwellii.AAC.1
MAVLEREIFKGEADIHTWMEPNLPPACLFGVFVDAYVVFELILMGHTNIQATTMERNMKLKVEADKALVLKTFENELPTLFGRSAGDSGAIKMAVGDVKQTWGMKVVLSDQIGTVKQQIWESIWINLAGHAKAQ